MTQEFVVSGDSHVVEPMGLFTERLPRNLRDKALTQTEFELEEPLVPGDAWFGADVIDPLTAGWVACEQQTVPSADHFFAATTDDVADRAVTWAAAQAASRPPSWTVHRT